MKKATIANLGQVNALARIYCLRGQAEMPMEISIETRADFNELVVLEEPFAFVPVLRSKYDLDEKVCLFTARGWLLARNL